jgi:Zn-dependent protease
MGSQEIVDGLIIYLGLVILLTFHEFGHAWMAFKCGDDTAKSRGRLSLNPMVHIDWLGTVVIPLVAIFAPLILPFNVGKFLIGWAKPVPVNPSNLRNPKLDDILITMAGPWMNLFLALILVGSAQLFLQLEHESPAKFCMKMAELSLLLCFFNLIPIPPLDGSHIVRVLTGMSYAFYAKIASFGFFIIIIVLQIPIVRQTLRLVTNQSLKIIAEWFGMKY